MSKHEELYSLFEAERSVSKRISAEQAKLYQNPFYGLFSKNRNNIYTLIGQREKLYSDFDNKLLEILRDNHGIAEDSIVGHANSEEFSILVDRKLHEVKPRRVGKRYVFFVDDVALGEDEKVVDLLKSQSAA